MGVVETDGRNAKRAPRGECLPRNLVRIPGLDQIGLLPLQRLLDEIQIDERPVA